MGDTYDIYVGSLLSCTTPESLTKLFGKFGKVVKVKIMEHSNSGGLKFAFVHYNTEDEALKAIEDMAGFMYNGVPLQVQRSERWLKMKGEDTNKGYGKMHRKFPNAHANFLNSSKARSPPGAEQFVKSSYLNTSARMSQLKADNNNTSPGTILKESIAVTHVEDPVTFYAYFASKHTEMNNLTVELQNICPTIKPMTGNPVEARIYGSMYSVDRLWYRCKILRTDKNVYRSHVQYIDFGNVENVSNSSLVELPTRLQIISPFTMKCVLKNLVPLPNGKRYDEALMFIKRHLIDHIVTAVLHVVGNGSVLQVSEIHQKGLNIVEAMISMGYLVYNFASDSNRNTTIQNCNISGRVASKGRKMYSPDSKNNSSAVDQEKAQLIAENKKLRYELAQATGIQKALRVELKNVSRSLVEPNLFTELPSVLSDIEKVRHLRQQLPVRSNCVDYMDTAVRLLGKSADVTRPFDKEHRDSIQKNVSQYYTMQKEITECKDKVELQRKIEERNVFREELREKLTSFCTIAHSGDVMERINAFKVVLAELQKIYKTFLEMKMFSETALPLEELHSFYASTKAEKTAHFLEVQRQTDFAHRSFFRALQPGFQNLDHRDVKAIAVPELTKLLNELRTCLADEIKTCTLEDTSEASVVGVLSHVLCEKLEMELAGMELTEHMEKQYTSLVESLNSNFTDPCPPAVEQLTEMRKEEKKLKSQLRHILADKIDLEENDEVSDSERLSINQSLADVQYKLHKTFLEEDELISSIAHLQDTSFPELNNLYPDFGLQEYNKYKGHLKTGWEIEHFDLKPLQPKLPFQTVYTSTFMGKPVRLQEYQISSDIEKEALLQYILQYSAVSHPKLMPVEAVFFTKKRVHAYVQQPAMSSLQFHLEESKEVLKPIEILTILKGILEALAALHSRGLVHGCLHPSTIYLKENKEVVVDSIPFQPHKFVGELPTVNGIVFQLMDAGQSDCNSYDVYSFACLSIWLMYPKTEFQLSSSGKPITQDLPKVGYKTEVMDLISHIMDSPSSYLQAYEILLHPALNQSSEMLDQLEIFSEDTEIDPYVLPEIDSYALPETDPYALPNDQSKTEDETHEDVSMSLESLKVEDGKDPGCGSSTEDDDSDNAEDVLLTYDSIRMNQCSLGIPETVQNT